MPRMARGEYLDPGEIQIVHTIQRCVRRAFLCGQDCVTGQSYDHRRKWIRKRIEFLSSVFGIDCLTYAVMSNHLHVVLRSRPDIVATWSNEEVARRWIILSPLSAGQLDRNRSLAIETLANNKTRILEIRRRLSDISWWMRYLAEKIARLANREDNCTGRFWEGRFRAQLILDESSLLACMAYVDLNPVRAALSNSIESCEFTGAKDRHDDSQEISRQSRGQKRRQGKYSERNGNGVKSGWLSPIEIKETKDPVGADPDDGRRRASKKGILSISLERYFEILNWTIQNLGQKHIKQMPMTLTKSLGHMGFDEIGWQTMVEGFGRLFKRVVGTKNSVNREAIRRKQTLIQCPGSIYFADS